MIYQITAIKRSTMPKRDGGTWTKVEVKTKQTGEMILELGRGIDKNVKENIKRGTEISGYIEKRPWTGRDGQTRYNNVLNGITAEYVYELLLRAYPDVESLPGKESSDAPVDEGWDKQGSGEETEVIEGNDW